MLGVILKLFNLLLSICREIDKQQVDSPTHKAALEANETAWERKRVKLVELDKTAGSGLCACRPVQLSGTNRAGFGW